MLGVEELDRIARIVARGDDDIWGEVWIKFMRVKPETRTGAWRAAKWARDSWWRKQKRISEHEIHGQLQNQ